MNSIWIIVGVLSSGFPFVYHDHLLNKSFTFSSHEQCELKLIQMVKEKKVAGGVGNTHLLLTDEGGNLYAKISTPLGEASLEYFCRKLKR